MKKARKTLALMVFASVLMICLVTAITQTTNPWSASSTGGEKNEYTSLEDVYVKSDTICEPAPSSVDLYIVKNIDSWTDGTSLDDVRGDSQEIILQEAKIPLTKIWDTPKAGEYDIVIDCNKDGNYNRGEPADNFYRAGFKVTAVAGRGKAEVGLKNIGDHTWRYDPEEANLINRMLQLKLTAEGENIELKNIKIRATGSGDDVEIDKLEVYADENANGAVDEGEVIIGDSQPAYSTNNGITAFNLEYVLNDGIAGNILITYTMKQTLLEGEFALVVESISGVGESSKKAINFSNLPITSGATKVLPEKTCLGALALEFTPSPAIIGEAVTAKMSGLEGCQNKTIVLRTNPCGSSLEEKVGACTLKDSSCNVSLTALKAQTYHACIDKNEDGDMIDFGEYTFIYLETSVPIPVNVTETNITEEMNVTEELNVTEGNLTGEEAPITGGVVGLWGKISETGSFFILLEVTLLLILLVLVIIMFRLKSGRKKEE